MEYKSPALRTVEDQMKSVGGVKNYCLRMYAQGCTYKDIERITGIPYGTLQRYMRKWRMETKQNG